MIKLSTPLSTNFTIGELLRSDTVERDEHLKQVQFNPPDEIVDNLRYLVNTVLQPVRTQLGFPVRINSGYRCPALNSLVGGSGTSQHCRGEAVDCSLSPRFLTDPGTETIREEIKSGVLETVGRPFRADVNQNFYLFALVCLNLAALDIDQVIHEFGDFGHPAWVHISCSRRQNKRQILKVGQYTNGVYINLNLTEAVTNNGRKIAKTSR